MSIENYDVIIVGAGFAGVTASRELSNRGYKTLILEGRDRIGGRTWFEDRMGTTLELGGTYVHWNQPHMWAELSRYNIEIKESPIMDKALWISEGKLVAGSHSDMQDKHMEGMTTFLEGSENYFPRPFDVFYDDSAEKVDHISVADRLKEVKHRLDKDTFELLRSTWSEYVSSDDLEDPSMSMAYRWHALAGHNMNEFQDTFELYSIKTGTKSLIDAIFNDSKAELKLSTPVSKIEKAGDGHKVTTRNGEVFTAKAVIAAVPINVINNIAFEPALPAKIRELGEQKQTSRGIKVWAKVRGLEGSVTMKAPPEYPVNAAHVEAIDGDEGLIMGFGNDASLDMNDPKAVQEVFRKWLPNIEVVDSVGHNWVEDEFSKGTWGVLKTGQLSNYIRECQKEHDGLFIAGSDYANGWVGYMDGAIESGLRTSKRVDNLLQEKKLILNK